ncbi:bifunctional polysaccharide deacetylase/glycosyltransferase family 2 protein [Actinopolymorpha sp. B17G11]|uniref:bifunctional polysaccharide deacetylase/glycosyltransferase family 2 protein n=1 Tax=Actinopolymorpha sp. B17G11 TaxID=3160861 RepID=UPI0032E41629
MPRLRLTPVVVLVAFLCVLLLEGYVHGEFAADHRVHPPVAYDRVPAKVLEGGPILDTTHARPHHHRIPAKTVVLTFDDGPDPVWTPKVLAVLEKHGVHATFFVVGQMAARNPGVVRDLVDSGQEIGVHTFSHPDLVYQSKERIDRELAQTQVALAGAAGIRTSLFRPPYSSFADALDNLSWPVVEYLGTKGYITAFNDTDSLDWQRPGVEAIVERATPKSDDHGAVVLLHDSGGDRSQTVAALDVLIPQLKDQGYRFTTVAEALGAESVHHGVTGLERWRGLALVGAVTISDALVPALVVLLVLVGIAMFTRFATMLVLARRHARQRNSPGFTWGPAVTEPVSIIVPAYNERECIANTVLSLAPREHPLEIIVVDDGSTDGTADIVEALGLPSVTVVRQENAGKAAALNTGISWASHQIIVMMDGDTVFEPTTVGELIKPFADARIGAVAGNAKVGNRDTMIGRWQHIEYVMGFNLDRRMYDVLRCMPCIPGAVGAFRRSALRDAGLMSDDTLAEDTDVTMALHRAGWDVVYAEHARAWTEAPGTLSQLWRQRYRWSYGTMQAMWKHRRAVFDRGHSGRFGRVGLPLVAVFQVLMPLFAPLIDIFTLYGLLFQDPLRTALIWCGVLGVQAACAVYAFRLDGEKLRPLWALPLQQLCYRQVMYLVLLQSCLTAVTGGRLYWHKLRRTGEVGVPAGPSSRHKVSA